MGLLKLFGGKTPEDLEKKGDALFEAGEVGRAKIAYEDALEKGRKNNRGGMSLERRLEEKIGRSREALAVKHKDEGLEILESDYDDAAEECFRLALSLTEDPELVRELEGLLVRIRQGRETSSTLPELDADLFTRDGDGDAGAREDRTETFAALIGSLPGGIQKAYQGYGEAFREGFVALNEGDFPSAADLLSEALQEHPEGDFILPALATAYLNLDMHTEAWDLAERFLEAHPEDLSAYTVLCEILWTMEEHDAALRHLDACPEPLAESVPVLLLRGETLHRARRLGEAEELLQEALDAHGSDTDLTRALALTFEAQGRKEEARDLYEKLLSQCQTCAAPADPFAKRKVADLSFELGDRSSRLLGLLLSLVREHPAGRAEAYDKIRAIYEAQGNEAEARRFEEFARQAGESSE
jgi:tetratricopeptide (TPR) repeat protein